MVNKSTYFTKFREFITNNGIELIKYKNGESLTPNDYASLFRAFLLTLIGVCVEQQDIVNIEGLCQAGFDVGNQKFAINIDESIQDKLEKNHSMVQNNLLIPVTTESVFYMLNESTISEVLL